MICLALDTAGSEGGVALAEFDGAGNLLPQSVFSRMLPPREVSRLLIPAISELLAEANCVPADIDCLAAVRGPGSFTGIRVGLAAVKGMADARACPVLGVSRLALLTAAGRAATGNAVTPAYSVLDAGRGEFYVGAFAAGALLAETEGVATYATLQEKLRAAPAPVFGCEPGVLHTLAGCSPQSPVAVPAPGVMDLLPFVALARAGARGLRFVSADLLSANYVRHAYPLPTAPASSAR